jgi:lycopene elongase/hydratase (dihydrobisanhydrobacterioruberin-forming)
MKSLISISRPRFWMYILGPIGLAFAVRLVQGDMSWSVSLVLYTLYCTIPANILIYGVNDIFDYETDILNQKKQGYEAVLDPTFRPRLWRTIGLFQLLLLPVIWIARENTLFLFALFAFLCTGFFYSAPPIRAKIRPVLDGLFNVLYILPAFAWYYLSGGEGFSLVVFLSGWAWCVAMHAYSAIPDISADRAAGLDTVATFLGHRYTVMYCLLLYVGSAIGAAVTLHPSLIILGIPYVWMMAQTYSATETESFVYYRRFPAINAVVGAFLWWSIIWFL